MNTGIYQLAYGLCSTVGRLWIRTWTEVKVYELEWESPGNVSNS